MYKETYVTETHGKEFWVIRHYQEANPEGDMEDHEHHVGTFDSLVDARRYITRCTTPASDLLANDLWVEVSDETEHWKVIGLVRSSFWTPNNILKYVVAFQIGNTWLDKIYNPSEVDIEPFDNMTGRLGYEVIEDQYNGIYAEVLVRNEITQDLCVFSKGNVKPTDKNAPVLYWEGVKLVFVRFEK